MRAEQRSSTCSGVSASSRQTGQGADHAGWPVGVRITSSSPFGQMMSAPAQPFAIPSAADPSVHTQSALVDSPLSTKVYSRTQSIERGVKLTTEAVATVVGDDRQDGRALNILAQRRQQLP